MLGNASVAMTTAGARPSSNNVRCRTH